MISRVAESCFWLNRYVERVEVLARMLNANLAFQLDVELPHAERWRPLVIVTGQEHDFLQRTPPDQVDDPETVQHYLTWSAMNPASGTLAASSNAKSAGLRTIAASSGTLTYSANAPWRRYSSHDTPSTWRLSQRLIAPVRQ